MTGILRKYHVNISALALGELLDRDSSDPRYDMDQPYQRGIVWGMKRRQNLVKSLLMGVPVPAIVMNDRFKAGFSHPGYDRDRNWRYAIVDGKQRITTIQGFVKNQFYVPREWFYDEPIPDGLFRDKIVYYDDLELPHQRHLRGIPVAVATGQFKTLAQEEELFNLVNFGGLAQGEIDDDLIKVGT